MSSVAPGTTPEAIPEAHDAVATPAPPAEGQLAKPKKKGGLQSMCGNLVLVVMILYSVFVGYTFYGILFPSFPEVDEAGRPMKLFKNRIRPGQLLTGQLFMSQNSANIAADREPDHQFQFAYEHNATASFDLEVDVSKAHLAKLGDTFLTARIVTEKGNVVSVASSKMIKYKEPPPVVITYKLLTQQECPAIVEPHYGDTRDPKIARGLPKMQVRLVYDETKYPPTWKRGNYVPQLFVDELWLTADQLIKLGENVTSYNTTVMFDLMSSARWRFQQNMEQGVKQNEELFGEDSQEMLQMRDLIANTNPYLLAATFITSFLHLIFEFLAFRSDVEFYQETGAEKLAKYVSLNALLGNIVCEVVVAMYLFDQGSSLLVSGMAALAAGVDCWKVWMAMKVSCKWIGPIPVPTFTPRAARSKGDNFDGVAMKWLTIILSPCVVVFAAYNLHTQCYRSWYSYFIETAATSVYTGGFVLMTPQLFINYKLKSVAYMPWKRLTYRAINTFIDDLFSFIIRMPTMHRISAFRDDVVFLIYLYQRWIYKIDKERMFDEEGPEKELREAMEASEEEPKKEK